MNLLFAVSKLLNLAVHWPSKVWLVFYDNRNLKISKSKKSEGYFRDKIEIFIRLSDEHFAHHFESHWRETWRHTARRTVPQISLETPSSPPPPTPCLCPTHVPYLDYSKRDNTPWLLSNHISESNFVIGEKTGGPNYVRVRWTLNLSVDL